ncbi:electron transfer flavoprotein subunit alpha/FixB family protein [Halorubrum trapanicum]|nr:electron transfer flavoprotein subunit alpha/FixB family protein [Halorubrum trapanicum]
MMSVLVVAEHRRGDLRDVSYEAITAGRELADARGGDLHVAVIGGDVDGFAEDLNREGVDGIHAVADGEEFDHNAYQAAVSTLAERLDAGSVVVPNSVNGLDYAPALAEALGVPIVTDAVGIEYDDGLTVTREMYGSKVETTVDVAGDRFVLTVRGGEWPPAEGVGDATVESVEVDIPESGARVTGFEEVGGGDVDIADADVLVSVGRGIEEEENLELVEGLADALGATLSASRPIVDNGWLPKNRQVGQSGKVVTPDVYIAIGISGAVQHVAGMKGSDTIIAINTDPNAPIFDIADYGIVGDLFDVVPELIDEFA